MSRAGTEVESASASSNQLNNDRRYRVVAVLSPGRTQRGQHERVGVREALLAEVQLRERALRAAVRAHRRAALARRAHRARQRAQQPPHALQAARPAAERQQERPAA